MVGKICFQINFAVNQDLVVFARKIALRNILGYKYIIVNNNRIRLGIHYIHTDVIRCFSNAERNGLFCNGSDYVEAHKKIASYFTVDC
jgi:hypothetical protein